MLRLVSVVFFGVLTSRGFAQNDFGAYYTRLSAGQPWEGSSRTGEYADVVVRLRNPAGQLVFWRGTSYLPYWKTGSGQWSLSQIVARSGDGDATMPDRVNLYSHAEIIENSATRVIVHWRYLPTFTKGNPRGKVDPDNFVDETFTVTPDGSVSRIIKQGTSKIDDWKDPLNYTLQALKLSEGGITETKRTAPSRTGQTTFVKGEPLRGPAVVQPRVQFKFDESRGDTTQEDISKTQIAVPGAKTYWKKGVSGTALEFDGYHTVVSLPAAKAPRLGGGSLTLEGWVALGAYPWNWTPLVQQGDDDGYFLGVDSHGYPGFMVKVDNVWQQLTVPGKPPYTDANQLQLFRWHHLAGVYDKANGMMHLYLDGKEIASKAVGQGGVQTVNADVRVGKAGVLRAPTEGTNNNKPTDYGLDGLLDEVKIYDAALRDSQVAQSYRSDCPGPDVANAVDMEKRAFPIPRGDGQFGAVYTHLPYFETWDDLWRVGPYADVVVGFDGLPIHYVFWRGVSYIPMMVNESNQWYFNEFSETGFSKNAPGDCEPMSDKACLDSHVRVIENTPARVVVHWRYELANPEHHWAYYDDESGWGDIADWYYYIYPDGVVSKRMRCYTSEPKAWHEWDEQIFVMGDGQRPQGVIGTRPVMTLVDPAGKAVDYDWTDSPPKPDYKGKIIEKLYFTGQYDPFTIQTFTGGDIYRGERTWYSTTPAWNHWPTAQIDSSGRNASFPDRASHSSIGHLFWPVSVSERGAAPYDEKVLLEGLTNQSASSLTGLASSWLDAPVVSDVAGGSSQGFDQGQRAYAFTATGTTLSFRIDATEKRPIRNACFVIKNWPARTSLADLKINGAPQAASPNFRQGVTIDTNGSYTMIVWVGLSADAKQTFEISSRHGREEAAVH